MSSKFRRRRSSVAVGAAVLCGLGITLVTSGCGPARVGAEALAGATRHVHDSPSPAAATAPDPSNQPTGGGIALAEPSLSPSSPPLYTWPSSDSASPSGSSSPSSPGSAASSSTSPSSLPSLPTSPSSPDSASPSSSPGFTTSPLSPGSASPSDSPPLSLPDSPSPSLMASPSPSVSAPPTAAASTAPLSDSGLLGFSSPGLLDDDSSVQLQQLTQMKSMGMTTVRVDANWMGGEPSEGNFDWSTLDRIMASVRQAGMTADLIIDGCPSWAAAPGATGQFAQPASPSQFAAWAGAVAARYSSMGAHYFEIWNEPNISGF